MLMQLGDFVFERATLAPDSLDKTLSVNWPKQARFRGRPAAQYTGVESETMTVSGVIYPSSLVSGTAKELDSLREMAVSGDDYIFVSSDGAVLGVFAITTINEGHSLLDKQGAAQKITFQVSLQRTDDERIDQLL